MPVANGGRVRGRDWGLPCLPLSRPPFWAPWPSPPSPAPVASGGGRLPPGTHPDSQRGPRPWRGDHGGRGWGHAVQLTISSPRSDAPLIGFLYQQMDCAHRRLHLLKDDINLGEKREAAGGYQHTGPVKGPPRSISGINSSFIRARSGPVIYGNKQFLTTGLRKKKRLSPNRLHKSAF